MAPTNAPISSISAINPGYDVWPSRLYQKVQENGQLEKLVKV